MKAKKISALLSAMAIIMLCLFGCTPEDTPSTDGETFAISQTAVTLGIGQSVELTAQQEGVVWLSSDSTIVSVENGTVTGIREGTATVTAISEKGSAECRVKVENTYYPVLSIVNKAATLFLGSSYNMEARVRVGNETVEAQIVWSSSDEAVAAVDADGKITTKAKGAAVITATATYQGITLKDQVSVRVSGMSYIDAPGRIDMGLYAGDATMEVAHTVYIDKQPIAQKATITSQNPDIVSVDADGRLKTEKEGSAIVTLRYFSDAEELSMDIPVTVKRHILHTFSKSSECYYAGDIKKQNNSTIGEHWTCKPAQWKAGIGGRDATSVYIWAYYWNPALSFSMDISKADLQRYLELGYEKVVIPVYTDSEYTENIRLEMGGEQSEKLPADGWKEVEFPLAALIANYDAYAVKGTPMLLLKNCWATDPTLTDGEVGFYVYFGDVYLR